MVIHLDFENSWRTDELEVFQKSEKLQIFGHFSNLSENY